MKETLHTRCSVLGMFIDLLLSPCLSLSLLSRVSVCVRSISFRFQQHGRKCHDRPNFIDRVCLIGRHPFTKCNALPHRTHTDGKGHLWLTYLFWIGMKSLKLLLAIWNRTEIGLNHIDPVTYIPVPTSSLFWWHANQVSLSQREWEKAVKWEMERIIVWQPH